jgi:hypothetical protein
MGKRIIEKDITLNEGMNVIQIKDFNIETAVYIFKIYFENNGSQSYKFLVGKGN